MKNLKVLMLLLLLVASQILMANGKDDKQMADGTSEMKELTYWEMQWGPADTYGPAVQALADAWAETQDNVKVTVQMTAWDNFYQTFLTAVTSGNAPDLSTGATPQPNMYAVMGEILYVDSIIEEWRAENNPVLEDIGSEPLEFFTLDGHYIALPWNTDPRVITYRTDYFKEAGITELPGTWPEFLDACEKLKQAGHIPLAFGAADLQATQCWEYFSLQNATGFMTKDYKASINTPAGIETLQFFRTLAEKEYISPGTIGYTGDEAKKLYLTGDAAMFLNGPIADLVKYPELQKNTSVLNAMVGPSGDRPASEVWINGIMGYKQTDYPDEVKSLMKWWIENNESLWSDGLASVMPIRYSYTQTNSFKLNNYKVEVANRIYPTQRTALYPLPAVFDQYATFEGENTLGYATQSAITVGGDSLVDIAKEMDRRISEVMSE